MFGDVVVRVKPDAWRAHRARCARSTLDCDYLSFVAGIDWMPTPAVAEEGSGDTSAPAQPKEQTYGVGGQRRPLPSVRGRRVDAPPAAGA